jgi:hypothetical protein
LEGGEGGEVESYSKKKTRLKEINNEGEREIERDLQIDR